MAVREIIFRGKRVDNGEWTTGTPFFAKDRCKMIHAVAVHPDYLDEGEGHVYYSEGYPVIPDTAGQYIGLTDKNGVKIFEGDIIRAVLPETVAYREFVWKPMYVVFHDGAFGVWLSQREFAPLSSFSSRVEFTIIGNIHDNPELLEEAHDGENE